MVGPPSCQLWHPGQPPLPVLTQLQAEGISASLSFSVWSWSALDSDVTQLSKLLQQGPRARRGLLSREELSGSRKCRLFMFCLFTLPCLTYLHRGHSCF